MTSTTGPNVQQLIPILRSFDETKAKEFYVEYLGFDVLFEHRFDDNAPLYFGLKLSSSNDIVLHLSEHHGDCTPGSTLRLHVEDIDALHATLSAKEYKNARPGIQDQPWGYREMKITDPFGNNLVFCQNITKKEE